MHVVLRKLDRDAEQKQEHKDLPPAAPRYEAGEIQRQCAVADHVAELVVEFEFIGHLGGWHQADDHGSDDQQYSQRPPHASKIHGVGLPMTSAPDGGVNFTSDSATGGLRSLLKNSSRTVWPSLSLRTMRLSSDSPNPRRASRKSASLSLGVTRTQSNPSFFPAGATVNSSRMSPSPESSPAGVAVSAAVAALTDTCSRSRS